MSDQIPILLKKKQQRSKDSESPEDKELRKLKNLVMKEVREEYFK
jgi:hypothetical protein